MIWLASEDKWGSVLALISGGACLFFVNLDKLNPHFPSSVDIQCGEKAILL